MNIAEILTLKFPDIDFERQVILQDDGQGVYIKEWNVDVPVPTQKDLDKWSTEVKHKVYPSIQEQLDMIYHDKINNTTIWTDTITAIKNDVK